VGVEQVGWQRELGSKAHARERTGRLPDQPSQSCGALVEQTARASAAINPPEQQAGCAAQQAASRLCSEPLT
jgi:hypothetical protein